MKLGKIIGGVILGALAVSAIPYQFKKDEATGALEIRSLLWGLRKTPAGEGETKDRFTFAIPPAGLDDSCKVEIELGEPAAADEELVDLTPEGEAAPETAE